MSKELNPTPNTWHDAVTIPSPGEPRNVANSLEGPMQRLLDNVGWLKTAYTQLSTTGLADGSVTTTKVAAGAVTLPKLVDAAKGWEIAWYDPAKPPANTTVTKYVFTRGVLLRASYGGAAHASVAPTAQVVLTIRRGAAVIGTVTFGAGQQAGAVAISADTQMQAGDVLTLSTPASQDSALSGVAVTLSGVLT